MTDAPATYRGRIAPSPTGFLHLGHARTFWTAQERCTAAGGTLILRNEDLDRDRCKPGFLAAMFEDLKWFGFTWREGPDVGGPCAPYNQSERTGPYREALEKLRAGGFVYPCTCSRKDIQLAAHAPHAEDEEPIYPGTCRPGADSLKTRDEPELTSGRDSSSVIRHSKLNWRFRVPDGETISFLDARLGPQSFVAGRDFGDFIVWRNDDVPAYQLAVVVDDALMRITEVVRGADLLLSTARQLLLYRALGWKPPAFFHCELMRDEQGVRLAKRHDALSLQALPRSGAAPGMLRIHWK